MNHTKIRARVKASVSCSTPTSTASPLKAAATLIQSLDIAHTEMSSFAADAARDAESARRNARAAHEIARRYQSQSYPRAKSSLEEITVSALSSKSSKQTHQSTFNITSSSAQDKNGSDSTTVTPRPKPPKFKPLFVEDYETHADEEIDILAFAEELETPHGMTHKIGSSTSTPQNAKIYSTSNDDTSAIHAHHASKAASVDSKSRRFHTASSVERIAQHHAEDVLQLSLELERTKQELKSEQRIHQECKTALASMKSKTTSLEERNQKLLEMLEKERQQSRQQVSLLEQEMNTGRLRLQAAEEDAQLALDLAKDSAEQRDQLEEELRKALAEIRLLKTAGNNDVIMNGGSSMPFMSETPRRHVRFADSEGRHEQHDGEGETSESAFQTPMSSSSIPSLSRALVATGRQILRRQMATSPQDILLQLELTPAKSAERRLRLRQRLTELDSAIEISSSTTSSPARGTTPSNSPLRQSAAGSGTAICDSDSISVKKQLEECHTAIKILQTSGKRLDLDGYWWRESNSIGGKPTFAHPIQLDAMTRQYCQNVEVRLVRGLVER
jgi:hypothetical protein